MSVNLINGNAGIAHHVDGLPMFEEFSLESTISPNVENIGD